jgi:hypothetical protein
LCAINEYNAIEEQNKRDETSKEGNLSDSTAAITNKEQCELGRNSILICNDFLKSI